jgi:chloramphenicol-sensitive protein RarD
MGVARNNHSSSGPLFALLAYGVWGLFPYYWSQLDGVAAVEILLHRILWSLPVVVLFLLLTDNINKIKQLFNNKKVILTLCISATLISVNWLTFLFAISSNRILDSSLGYYLGPLVNILLGVVLLKERLRTVQWVAVGLATIGVLIRALSASEIPWIALVLAFSFSLYGLVRKQLQVNSILGLTMEMVLLAPIVITAIIILSVNGLLTFGFPLDSIDLLLILGGPVTVLPLVWLVSAAKRMNYSTLGFFQFITPTGHFILAVVVFNEALDGSHLFAFGFIWSALLLYSSDHLRRVK